jgi:hypothetical protein
MSREHDTSTRTRRGRPTATRIAFLRVRTGDGFPRPRRQVVGPPLPGGDLHRGAGGSGLHRITAWGRDVGAPDWSPSGRRIVATGYWDTRRASPAPSYTMRPDGKDIRRLFDDGSNTSNGSDHPRGPRILRPALLTVVTARPVLRFLGFDGGAEMDTVGTDGGGLETRLGAPTDVSCFPRGTAARVVRSISRNESTRWREPLAVAAPADKRGLSLASATRPGTISCLDSPRDATPVPSAHPLGTRCELFRRPVALLSP